MNKSIAQKWAKTKNVLDIKEDLISMGYWDDPKHWRNLNDQENNFSMPNNQGANSLVALVEKLVNSMDAILMKVAAILGITPDSKDCPKSPFQAVAQFFGIKDGKFWNLSGTKIKEFAKDKIVLAADGTQASTNVIIADWGEGQTPKKIPETICSLSKSNKLSIPFCVGTWGQGGSGVYPYLGSKKTVQGVQLIITKRCPDIKEEDDGTKGLWGITVTRRITPDEMTNHQKTSKIVYLVDENNEIMTFEADELDIVPDEKEGYRSLQYGMFCKLFDYELGKYQNQAITRNGLFLALGDALPEPAIPFCVEECRDDKKENLNPAGAMSGLMTRLINNEDVKNSPIQETLSSTMRILGKDAKVNIYVFKEASVSNRARATTHTNYGGKENGVLFIQNGQTHASYPKSFFSKKDVGLGFIEDSLLVLVDMTDLTAEMREDIFMTSRDRMRQSDLTDSIIKQLMDLLNSNERLQEIQDERKLEALKKSHAETENIAEAIFESCKKIPEFKKLFNMGESFTGLKDMGPATTDKDFVGLEFPSYFKIDDEKFVDGKKIAELGRNFRVRFKTDVQDDYFDREVYPGTIEIKSAALRESFSNHTLKSGTLVVSCSLPENAKKDDEYEFEVLISDEKGNSFTETFTVKVDDYKPTTGGKGHNPKEQKGVQVPEIVFVSENEWAKYDFNERSGFRLYPSKEKGWLLVINDDNIYYKQLKEGLLGNKDRLHEAEILYGQHLLLLAMGIIKDCMDSGLNDDDVRDEVIKVGGNASAIIHQVLIEIMKKL